MSLLRSERFPAIVLLGAAALGLVVANTAAGSAVTEGMHVALGIPGVFELSVEHWIKDGLLALFFFVVAVELRHEVTDGQLNTVRKAIAPAIAAAGGVIVPIVIYLLVAGGSPSASGWPVPTATDIAFALGVLAVFGRGLPPALRVFLLALAILDDIVGIIFIAAVFTDSVKIGMLAAAAVCVVLFSILSRQLDGASGDDGRIRLLIGGALVVLAIGTWVFVYESGVHATIAGVALGLAMRQPLALRARHALEPAVYGLVLPVFAFSAALVVIPQVSPAELQPAFWGVLIALPVGKIIGISVFGWLALRIGRRPGEAPPLAAADLIAIGALGGIGFTVSLLLAELAFPNEQLLRDEATLGVLAGSLLSLVLAGIAVSMRARHHRRAALAEAAGARMAREGEPT